MFNFHINVLSLSLKQLSEISAKFIFVSYFWRYEVAELEMAEFRKNPIYTTVYIVCNTLFMGRLSKVYLTPCICNPILDQASFPFSPSVFWTSRLFSLSRRRTKDTTTFPLCREGVAVKTKMNVFHVFSKNILILDSDRISDFPGTGQWLRCCQVCILFVFYRKAWRLDRAWNEGYPKVREDFTITKKAFSWLKDLLVLSH